ncbi:MAG: 1-acyl-sn-glycerol-3-phosphate acyltransferase [Bacteroidales bacterium]|nr:1-acyl-sn-glycerol-3-phosphate acyltransferase [Bacteroidales bacterium]
MKNVLVTVYMWIVFIGSSIILTPIAIIVRLITHPFDKSLKALHYLTAFWGYVYLFSSPYWSATYRGLENIKKEGRFVIISNHQSLIDIVVLFQIKHQYKWVAKAELFRMPFVGYALMLNNYIKILRGDRKSMAKMMQQSVSALKKCCSILVFPEGTRTLDGNIKKFKDGAFKIACDAGVDVVPIVLDGTADSMPKKGFLLKPTKKFVVSVLPPVSSQGKDYHQLSKECHALMVKELTKLRSGQKD